MVARYATTGSDMQRFLIPLATTLLAISVCHAEAGFLCAADNGVTRRAQLCAEGDATVQRLKHENDAEASPPSAPAKATIASGPLAGPAPPNRAPAERLTIDSRRDELLAGMTDLEVLNNRRWGKPQRIARNREARGWHEHWSYDTGANGGKQLHFINGTLDRVENIAPPAPRFLFRAVFGPDRTFLVELA